MSSGEGASQNRPTTEDILIETCYKLLKSGDFLTAHSIVNMNHLDISKRHDLFEKARAICDVLIAAENQLPNGLMDLYGMIRVNLLGPVLLEDFEKLMKLLDKRSNRFPFCQEAADKALLAWSLLSKPHIKAHYDQVISADYNHETQGNDRGVGGSQTGAGLCEEGSNGKRKMGPGADDEVVVLTSDDDDDDDDGQEIITRPRTSKLAILNGKRVKLIPWNGRRRKTKDKMSFPWKWYGRRRITKDNV